MRAIMLVLVFALATTFGAGCSDQGGTIMRTPTDKSTVTWDSVVGGDVPGVMPGIFRVGNVHPGDTIDDWPADMPKVDEEGNPIMDTATGKPGLWWAKGDPIGITIYNHRDVPTPYSVTFALPHDPAAGYESAPPEAARWVIIGDPMPIVPARGTLMVSISIYIPKKVEVPDNWEFAIAVSEAQPPGNRIRASEVRLLEGVPPAMAQDVAKFLNSITWENLTDTFMVYGIVSEFTPPTPDPEGADYFVLTSGGRLLEVYFTHDVDPQVEVLYNGCEAVVTGTLLQETVVRTEMRVRWLISMG